MSGKSFFFLDGDLFYILEGFRVMEEFQVFMKDVVVDLLIFSLYIQLFEVEYSLERRFLLVYIKNGYFSGFYFKLQELVKGMSM